jgi:2-iminoacetate synthase
MGEKMYNMLSSSANDFIDHDEITAAIAEGELLASSQSAVASILEKARSFNGLHHREAAVLLNVTDPCVLEEIYKVAKQIKEHIYGRRIVIFAPLYLSDYCVNGCTYCGYSLNNDAHRRRRLTQGELREEATNLIKLGHKRLALETGEDPVNCSMDYVIECINTIYSTQYGNGAIRRVNVNVAATTVENYQRLKKADIGAYILFQETYHKPTYLSLHPKGPKRNYEWHTEAHDRAMAAGIGDVGAGVLYGLYDWKYDTVALLMHAQHLEAAHGAGPHTISVPRLRAADGVDKEGFPYLVQDCHFKQLVAVLRSAAPYAGIILTTREPPGLRDEVVALGVSQISAGSCTGVGGYAASGRPGDEASNGKQLVQFVPEDHRAPAEIIKSLLESGYVPSYCTACYRAGRTGERFMELAKTGKLADICQPNAILTLQEYIDDYGDQEIKALGETAILGEINAIPDKNIREKTIYMLSQTKAGARDLRF